MNAKANRGSIKIETAKIRATTAYGGAQHVIRLHAPRIANTAEPGTFIHLTCDESLPMRRPMSIMQVDTHAGTLDVLFKVHGHGTALLAARKVDQSLSVMGPIGKPFKLSEYRAQPLLIGGGVGIPPMVFLAKHLKQTSPESRPLVLMGSEVPFPFTPRPSQIMLAGIPADTIATMPLMDDWGIACRLASQQGYAGCFDGLITELARVWIESKLAKQKNQLEIFACGPTPMLKAVAKLSRTYDLPCQLSLEEYMACAVGGCAGCTVEINTPDGPAMKRVCVDGPVFEAKTIVFPSSL